MFLLIEHHGQQEAVEEISKLAPEGVDVLINNAGIAGSYTDPEQA